MQEPLKMDDGNWIMAGFAGGLPGSPSAMAMI